MVHPLVTRAVRTARGVRGVISRPPYVQPGHFYSPLTSDADVRRAQSWSEAPGVDLNEAGQLALLEALHGAMARPLPGPRFFRGENRMFGGADAATYRALLEHMRPSTVIEIGSGYSTAVALDVMDAHPELVYRGITCVEPYPDRLHSLMKAEDESRVTVMPRSVQDIPLAVYDSLQSGDILFIDSTHISKAGSDVNWLLLHVLPRIGRGVWVHLHDIFWPFEYPAPWLEEHRDWSENYLLHAFLISNSDWEVMLFLSWMWHAHQEVVPESLTGDRPGSIWLRRR